MQVNSSSTMMQNQVQMRRMDGSGNGVGNGGPRGGGMGAIMQSLPAEDRTAIQEQMSSLSQER